MEYRIDRVRLGCLERRHQRDDHQSLSRQRHSPIPVVNTASISSTETSAASSSVPVYVNSPRAQLAVQLDGNPSLVAAGSNVTFTVTYSNTGAAAASGVALSQAIPAGWSFVSATGGGTNSAAR